MNGKNFNPGVCARGIVTPFIQAGDDVVSIVYQCVMEQSGGTFGHRPIVCLTEAALAMAQDNLVPLEAISKDIEAKFKGAKTLVIVDPIQSRNRILDAIKAIASTPSLEKVIIVFTYPSDEVGNRFITNLQLIDSGLDMMNDILTEEEFIITSRDSRKHAAAKVKSFSATTLLSLMSILEKIIIWYAAFIVKMKQECFLKEVAQDASMTLARL